MLKRICLVTALVVPAACSDDRKDGGGDASASDTLGETSVGSASAESGSESTSIETTDSDGQETGQVKFDVGSETEGETEGVGCECGSKIGFSYIWPSNSNLGQVSKINTQTMVEEGRYYTSAGGSGSPSRSSVSLSGLSVAVNNRLGGVVKVWSRTEDCDEMENGQPGLQTSTGANDVLPWGQDDCVDWYIDPYGYTTQRPIGFIPAVLNQETCEYENEKLWTSGCSAQNGPNIWADRVDAATGNVDDHVEVTGFPCTSFGGYGGAVDADGNFWIINLGTTLAKVDGVTLDVTVWTIPVAVYGVTVDSQGRPWMSANMGAQGMASAVRYDPMADIFELSTGSIASAQTGIQEDGQGRMWMNYWNYDGGNTRGATYIDVDTMVVGPPKDLPTYGKGISIDLDGNVWTLGTFTDNAARYNPDTDQVDVYDGLTYPYTYSDMTGWALQNASCAPEG